MLAILALSAWVRVTQTPQVFVGDEVLPADGDASYHLHRIERSVQAFPRVPVHESLLNWPAGGPCPWAPGLDFMGAVLVKISGTSGDAARAARIASLLPLLLGLLLSACSMEVARRLVSDPRTGAAVGWAAGVALALIPQSVAGGRIARVDHHVAEALSMVLLAGWALAALRVGQAARPSGAASIRFEVAGAACAVFAGAMFSGAPLYVAIATILLIGIHLLGPCRTERWQERIAGSGGPALLAAAPLLAALNASAIAEHGQLLTYRFPSLLQPVLYGVAGLGLLASSLVQPVARSRQNAARRALARAAVLAAGSLLALALVSVLAPSVLAAVWAGCAEWLGTRDPWLSSISEFQPLDRALAYKQLGIFGLLAPVVLPFGLWRICRDDPARGAFLVAWTLLLLPLALLQSRFGRIFVVNLSIVWGLTAVALLAPILTRLGAKGRHPAAAALGACALLLLGIADPACRERLTIAAAREPSPIEAAARFLRQLSAAEPTGARGVLTDWELGNDIIWIAKLPVVAGGFGHFTGPEGFQEVMDYPTLTESQLIELMTRRQLGYVVTGSATYLKRVAGPQGSSPFRQTPYGIGVLNAHYFQSLPLSPVIVGGTGFPKLDVRHLKFLRPRFASTQLLRNLSLPVPILWVYERVRGAVLQGEATPGVRITATINLATPAFQLPYTAWTSADAAGSYELVIPLPSGLTGDSLRTEGHYTLRIGESAPQLLEVTERAVVDGELLGPLQSQP